MTVALQGIPPQIANLLQERTLERVFHDALYPRLLFRAEATPEVWQANLGERQIFTRAGLMPVVSAPLTPGQDPTPVQYLTEQWEAEARQFAGTIDTHMPSSYVALASLFLRNTQQLGLQAAQTLNRLARNAMYRPYLEGEAMVDVAATAGALSIHVDTLSGFTQKVLNGRLEQVSAGNPMPVTFTTASEPANAVVGFVPDNPALPFGPGLLQLQLALAQNNAQRAGIFAQTRARRLRVGAGATVDAITSSNIVTLDDIISAVTRLRSQNVPPHADGMYHVHVPPAVEAQIFRDNHWQRLHQSLPENAAYRDLAIGQAVGCYFYRNNETPALGENGTLQVADPGGAGFAILDPALGIDVVNANGLSINRTLVTGGGVLYEKYIDESKYITEAGVTGKIGEFNIVNGGVAVMSRRIRFILRAPLDRIQQVVSQSWSWTGDFPCPSDALAGDPARFKRAVVIESA